MMPPVNPSPPQAPPKQNHHQNKNPSGLSHDGLIAGVPGGPTGYWTGDAANNWAAHMG